MNLTVVSTEADVVRIRSEGAITPSSAVSDPDPLQDLLGSDTYAQTILWDMQDSDFINSNGVGWLLVCHKRFRKAGGRMVMHTIPPPIFQTLNLLRLHRVFDVADNEQAAMAIASGAQT